MDKRRERFLNYGARQVEKALHDIDRLKRFTETSNYVAEREELRKITESLKSKVLELEDYYFGKPKHDIAFSYFEDKFGTQTQNHPIELFQKQQHEFSWLRIKFEESLEQNQLLKIQQKQIYTENDHIRKQIQDLGDVVNELKQKLASDK